MHNHPITDSIKFLALQSSLLMGEEFEHIYPSLEQTLSELEKSGIPARKDLSILLGFLVNSIGTAKGTQTRFRNEAERFVLFCWHDGVLCINGILFD